MTAPTAQKLLVGVCAVLELTPEYWNVLEPIDIPFRQDNLNEIIYGAMIPSPKAKNLLVRTLTFFVRKTKPSCVESIDLRLAPVQWSTPHNRISVELEDPWPGSEHTLANYLQSSVLPNFPDYARVVDSSQEDPDRLNEFHRSYAPQELLQSLATRTITAPMGPYGCLEDVYWFNYFGRAYVEFIGRARLLAAGLARAEVVGDGLACYATETIADSNAREQRLRIARALIEFVWTPGCKAEDKQVPIFDFSEQLSALPADALAQDLKRGQESLF